MAPTTDAMAGSGEGGRHGVLDVTIQGSGPYGFRLNGGAGEPMTITKLRRQGKAHQAGLHEGDTVLGINGFSGRSMSHSAAMGLLESSVQSVQLIVFRGGVDGLNAAYDEVGSRLRPLPAGAAPPPRILPPPPTGETGSLVIDQPGYTRPVAERFVVVEDRPSFAAPPPTATLPLPNGHDDGSKLPWRPSSAPLNGPRQPKPWAPTPSFDPTEFVLPARMPSPAVDAAAAISFRVAHGAPSSTDPDKPWMWKPPVTCHAQPTPVVQEHQQTPPAPMPQQWRPPYDENDYETQRQQQQQRHGDNDRESSLPKWALPLRSDYDWKKSYPWLLNENVVIAEDDEWEYGYNSEGELVRRKKKVFADSSFYDDPEHKYPTIEEQIKMARRVAQSLTSATNVSARGHRMFMRRREKADRWVVSEIPQPGMAAILRRGLANASDRHHVLQPREVESDTDLVFYNPAPWARPDVGGREPVKTPTSGGRLPWKTDFDPASSAASGLHRPPSPPPVPAQGFGQQVKWRPQSMSASAPDVAAGGAVVPKHGGGASGKAAFNVSKELRQMKGKGGKMFARRRAQAAEDERREDLVDTLKVRHVSHIRGNDDDDVDWTEHHQQHGGSSSVEAEQQHQPVRLMELIERSRAASPGRRWTQQTTTTTTVVKDPTAYGNFSGEIKSRGGQFRPVRFKAPLGSGGYETYSTAEEFHTEGISEF